MIFIKHILMKKNLWNQKKKRKTQFILMKLFTFVHSTIGSCTIFGTHTLSHTQLHKFLVPWILLIIIQFKNRIEYIRCSFGIGFCKRKKKFVDFIHSNFVVRQLKYLNVIFSIIKTKIYIIISFLRIWFSK